LGYLGLIARASELNGKLNDGKKYIEEILEIVMEKQGFESQDYTIFNSILAKLYLHEGNIQKSAYLFKQSLINFQPFIKSNPEAYHNVLFQSAIVDLLNDDIRSTISKVKKVQSFWVSQINEMLVFLTPEEKEGYVMDFGQKVKFINSIYVSVDDRNFADEIYNNVLYSKSIALQSTQLLKNFILSNDNPNFLATYNTIKEQKEKIKLQEAFGQINDSFFLQSQKILINEEKLFLGKISRLPGFKKFEVDAFSWKDIQNALKPNEVAIEFVNIPIWPTEESEEMYYALILSKDYPAPMMIPLFKDSEIKI
jgi:hypothetical protein